MVKDAAGNVSAPIKIDMGAYVADNHTIAACFAKTTYYLTITAGANGSIIAGGSGSYDPGSVISIIDTPNGGYKFEK